MKNQIDKNGEKSHFRKFSILFTELKCGWCTFFALARSYSPYLALSRTPFFIYLFIYLLMAKQSCIVVWFDCCFYFWETLYRWCIQANFQFATIPLRMHFSRFDGVFFRTRRRRRRKKTSTKSFKFDFMHTRYQSLKYFPSKIFQ